MSAHASTGALHVARWHLAHYRRMWLTNLLGTFVNPMLYLLGLGVGVGALVDRNTSADATLGGVTYVAYVAPGLIVTTAMALGAAESMWPVMAGLKWQRNYHAMAATPLDARDIVFGHATWMAARCVLSGALVALALVLFPSTRTWGLLPTVAVAALVGVAFAMPIMAFSVNSEYDGAFAGIQRFIIIPLFLFGGAFYPLTQLPVVIQWLARIAPLWHGVVVSRQFTSGDIEWGSVALHCAYISLWAVAGMVVATRRLRRKLYP